MNRTKVVRFRVEPTDFWKIKEAAALDGFTLSELARRATLREATRMLDAETPAGLEPDGRRAGVTPRFIDTDN